jgi:hypothetical protein
MNSRLDTQAKLDDLNTCTPVCIAVHVVIGAVYPGRRGSQPCSARCSVVVAADTPKGRGAIIMADYRARRFGSGSGLPISRRWRFAKRRTGAARRRWFHSVKCAGVSRSLGPDHVPLRHESGSDEAVSPVLLRLSSKMAGYPI